jgi:hypothetical protein
LPSGSARFLYTAVNGRVVFLSQIGAGDFQCGLWVTDGPTGAVERLTDFCGVTPPGPGSPKVLAVQAAGNGNRVVFLTDTFGRLWRTDGTAAGTFSLGDVRVEGTFDDGQHGRELWVLAIAGSSD